MAYIKKRFHLYTTLKDFEEHRENSMIDPDSLVFIKETLQIYTQGTVFGLSKLVFDELLQKVEELKELIEGNEESDNIDSLLTIIEFLKGYNTSDSLKNLIDALEGLIAENKQSIKDLKEEVKEIKNSVGNADGIAPLGPDSKVPSYYLPSYVDDVIEFENKDSFPFEGESGKIYIAIDTNKSYRWSGTAYIEISSSLALGETESTAYPGNKGKLNAESIESIQDKLKNPWSPDTLDTQPIGRRTTNLFRTWRSLDEYYKANPSITDNDSHINIIENADQPGIVGPRFSFMQTVPYGNAPGETLRWDGHKAIWVDKNYEENHSYGIKFYNDHVTERTGNLDLHRELPIQYNMRGCVYNGLTDEVVYWLDHRDWRYKVYDLGISQIQQVEIKWNSAVTEYSIGTFKEMPLHVMKVGVPMKYIDLFSVGQYIIIQNRYYVNQLIKVHFINSSPVVNDEGNPILDENGEPLGSINLVTEAGGFFYIDNDTGDYISEPQLVGEWMILGSNLSGADGDVMVYVPRFWYKEFYTPDPSDTEVINPDIDYGTREVRISPIPIDESWVESSPFFVSPYKANHGVVRASLAMNNFPYMKEVINTADESNYNTVLFSVNCDLVYNYFQGNNDTIYEFSEEATDLIKFRSQYNKGITGVPLSNATNDNLYNRNILTYTQYKALFWLYAIEYASFSVQDQFIEDADEQGFKQGGLGDGVSGSYFSPDNYYTPIVWNGVLDTVGDGTAVLEIKISDDYPHLYIPKWRGIECPFGDLPIALSNCMLGADYSLMYNDLDGQYITEPLYSNPGMWREAVKSPRADIVPRNIYGSSTESDTGDYWSGTVPFPDFYDQLPVYHLVVGGNRGDSYNAGLLTMKFQDAYSPNNFITYRLSSFAENTTYLGKPIGT